MAKPISRRNALIRVSAGLVGIAAPAIIRPVSAGYRHGGVSGGGLFPGESLMAMDGESLTSATTMTNSYWSAYSATGSSFNGVSRDNPAFFPLSLFNGIDGLGTGDIATMVDLNLTDSIGVSATDVTSAQLTAGGIWALPGGYGPGGTGPPDCPSPIVGWCPAIHLDENDPVNGIGTLSNTVQDTRYWDWIETSNQIIANNQNGVLISDSLLLNFYTTPNATPKSIGTYAVDVYWMAGSPTTKWQGVLSDMNNNPMGGGSGATADQTARGSHYGQLIDVERASGNNWNRTTNGAATYTQTTVNPSRVPLYGYVENTNGNLGDPGNRNITAPEMNWAIWSSIIHGARGIVYFFTTGNFGASNSAIYVQAKATNALIKSLASVLNSPFSLGFASVSPAGYSYPTPQQNWLNGGIEIMTKYVSGKRYIFACTRYGQAGDPINQSATFTVPSGAGTTATILDGRGGSKAISGGHFTDTFVHSYDTFIYRID